MSFVKVSEIKEIMAAALRRREYQEAEIPFIVNMYLDGELRGHVSHGLASFKSFLKCDYKNLPEPEVIKATKACYFLDAKSNPGVLVGKLAADEAMARARQEITGVALIKNMDSWLRPGAIAQYLAEQGFIAYVLNSGGGAAISPPGGYEAVAGTNPIAYGLPTDDGALVVDLATAQRAWGVVRLANKFGTLLPEKTFYDENGQFTTDPQKAEAVVPFGGYKGFALAFFSEVMLGALLGMPMLINDDAGSNFGEKMPERGAYILAIDPRQTVGLAQFKTQVSQYIEEIEKTKNLPGEKIRIPGRQAMAKARQALAADRLELPDQLWSELQQLS